MESIWAALDSALDYEKLVPFRSLSLSLSVSHRKYLLFIGISFGDDIRRAVPLRGASDPPVFSTT